MKKLLISISLLVSAVQAWAVDTYNPANGQLTIPTVVVGDKLYTNVVVNISNVVAVNGGSVNSYWDTYNGSNGQLTIPTVYVGSTTYNNVVATLGGVVSIGGVLNANPTLSDAGIWVPVTDPNFISASYSGNLANTFHSLIHLRDSNQYGLVVTGWGFSGWPPTLTQAAPVNVGILSPISDGTLNINTSSFITDTKTNGGGSVVVADFNGDGKQDIFLAAHNESPFIAMPSTAYLTNTTNLFTKVVLSDNVMAHDAELAMVNGKPIVIASTFNPGDTNPIYTFSNGNFIENIHPELILSGMDAAIVNSGNGKYNLVKGDAIEGFNSQTQTSTAQNIQVFNFDSTALNVTSTQYIQDIVPLLSSLPQFKNFPSQIGGTGLTHTYRLWTDDINNDGYQDLFAGESMWSQSNPNFPSILQILINNGNSTFKDATLTLNPDMSFNTAEMDYNPNFVDLDNSGVKTYLFAGSTSFGSMVRQSDYIMLNDGTGRLYISLHDQFSFFADKIFNYLGRWYNQSSTPPRFIAIPQLDGSLTQIVH